MSGESEDKPLAKWSTGNLLGLFGFIAMIVTGWMSLREDVVDLQRAERAQDRTNAELKSELREVHGNLVRLMVASGVKPEGGE
jgi:cytochrome b